MREQQCQAKNAVESLAFASWLRSGTVPDDVTELARAVEAGEIEFKMRIVEALKVGFAGLVLLIVFGLGLIVGYDIYAWADRARPYLDHDAALRQGLKIAEGHCRRTSRVSPIGCDRAVLAREREDATGWFLIFDFNGGRRADAIWIGRRGEYRVLASSGDSTKAQQTP